MAKELYSLSNPQKSIWLTQAYYQGMSIENITGTVIVSQKLDFNALSEAINLFVKRNESFRLKFLEKDGEIFQYVAPYSKFVWEEFNVSSEQDIKKIEKKLSDTPFEVLDNFLFTFKLFKFENGHGGFFVKLHHLISDAWTGGIGTDEIMSIYEDLINNTQNSPVDKPSYIEFLSSEQEYLSSEKFSKDKAFWNEIFKEIPEASTIPTVKESLSNVLSCSSKRKQFIIPKETINLINEFCKENKASLFNFFMGVYSLYISKVSNQNDIVLGTPILNRSNFKEKQTTGMFVSTIPVKISIDKEKSFANFISEIGSDFLKLFRHQKYPYQLLLEDLRKKDSSIPNLYNILISYQNIRTNSNNLNIPYELNWIPTSSISDDLDIHICDLNDTGNLTIAYDYLISKYSLDDICNLHARILHMINQILENNKVNLQEIEIVTPLEKQKLLYDFNNTKTFYDKEKTICELFEEQVLRTPDNTALVFENESLTYKELNERANSLAYSLRQKGVSNNDILGIMVPRSLEMIVAILAVLKAGGCYIPIDPEYPKDRIEYMLDNSNAKMLLTFKSLDDKVSYKNKLFVELSNDLYNSNKNNLDNINTPEDLAYIIYTSGSTGKPKGVMLSHKNVNNFIIGMKDKINFINKTIVSVTTISFDIFVLESILPLQLGIKVVIANENEQTNVGAFNKLCQKNNVNIIQTTPSRFKVLISNTKELEYLKNITDILVGGEAFPKSLLNELKKLTSCKIYNVYGPTETTVWSTVKDLTNTNFITIGKPIANTTCYIFNNSNELLPEYFAGNLFIGGDGLSSGYLGKKDLTNEKFIVNPYIKNELIYNTGDLAYFDCKGELIHLGRNDFQVKINGHRIELEEIENEILKNINIKNCVVIKQALTDTHEYLCAYYTGKSNIDISLLRADLQKSLPSYMVPQYFMELQELPYTPNGKIDRKKLPKIEINNSQKEVVDARNNIDTALIKILKELLNLKEISITDSFFEIGGDSLTAINLCTKVYSLLNAQIYVKDILENPIIKDLSDLISSKNSNLIEKNIISKARKADYYPVSSAQNRMFFASNISGENSILYNISGGLIFDKMPDKQKLQKAFTELINRHSSLRTYFEMNNEEVVQKVLENVDFYLDYEETNSSLENAFKEFNTAFDLSKAPLFKAKLVKTTDNKISLLVSMHHIISDGTSLSIMMDELCKLYNEEALSKITTEYKDYAVFENKKLASNDFKDAENYWVNQFKNEIPVLNMPTKPRPSVQSFDGDKVYAEFNENLTTKINTASKSLGITPNMLLLSCYYILLYKYTMQDDIVVGTPIANRTYMELSNVIGMFVNTLPIRTKFTSNLTFNNFVDVVKANCLESYKYQDYPFDMLVNKLQLKRDISRNPLFDTSFIYQNNGYMPAKFNGIDTKYYIPNTKISKFDLSLEVVPNENHLNLSFEYATKLFDKQFIKDMANHYINIVKTILEKSDIKISEIDMLSEDEENKILYEFNNTNLDYPKDKTIADLFEEQVEKTPDSIAVVFENQKLTYKELNEKANSLAFALREKGVFRNDIVGIMVNRSLEMIVSILAVLKSGGCYIPIDPDYPKDRIEYMLENSHAKLILIPKHLENNINFSNKLFIDLSNTEIYSANKKNLTHISNPEDLAYIIYTSGSTGNPKGVCLYHKSLSNLCAYLNKNVEFLLDKNISIQKAIVSVTTISFDIFIFETLICLQRGLKIVVSTEEEQHIPSLLNTLLQKENIEIIQMTPSRMQIFLDNIENFDVFKSLKYVVLAGEPLPDSLLKRLLNLGIKKVYNGYGPSETTVFSTFTDVTDSLKVDIGVPLSNTQTYILDKDMCPCPVNIPGELYIGGDGVGKGYLNNETLTKKSYIVNPFIEDKIIYKTGDLCLYNKNGNISYLGRIDNQVKIRGLRIELGEIENKILSYPNIQKCCVIKQTLNNRDFISAYFTSSKRINISELRKYISTSLPKYMVPSYFTSLEDFPYTPNGKINKKALPLPKEILSSSENKTFIAPKTKLEKDFVNVWEQVLNISPIGITDNFFELGGDSILAMNLNIELKKVTDSISYADIFKFPTIEELIKKNNSTEEDYDFKYLEKNYDKYTDILKSNQNVPKIFDLKHINPGNILLAGATGFLGMHVLDSFLKNEKGNVYCLIRKENNLTAETKLYQKLNYYFGDKYNNLIGKRIFAITADICKPGFDLNQEDLLTLANNIDVIINCAAMVSHYGKYSDFYAANVQSVKYMIDFCKSFSKRFYHISTLSVSGNAFDSTIIGQNLKETTFFSESNLYIGQSLENVYIRSKFEAECLVLDSILDGVDSYILRVGNLMPRFKDGLFQENLKDNAFINRILSFIKIGVLPDYILNEYLEFSPVDITANSIIKLLEHPNKNNRIFHLFNQNHLYIDKALKYFKILNPEITILQENEFKNKINSLLKSKTKKELLNSLINDFDKDLHLQYKTDIIIKSDVSLKYLSKIGFTWPKITNRYMIKFLEILRRNL